MSSSDAMPSPDAVPPSGVMPSSGDMPSYPPPSDTPEIPEYLNEYELDSNGNKIPDGVKGWKITDRGRAARLKYRKACLKDRKPMSKLPRKLLTFPDNPYFCPPLIHFALPFSTDQMLDFNARHNIPLEDGPHSKYHILLSIALKRCVNHLCKLCDTYRLTLIIPCDVKHEWAVALHSNYNWYKEELVEEDEKEVVEIIKKELKIERGPKWYYDAIM
ncbi:hypothetical protein EWM64_g6774 [Hericium alpestre]|uniref:Uncharacterized protein n=1 Tax=Hericium alpestre TaxID=135208 RepID=A0A4Y9ZTT7_9AGAM|nr:hypothetical protein EWM64_g6774 [Hericium alpestre]